MQLTPIQRFLDKLLRLPDLLLRLFDRYRRVRALIKARNWQLVESIDICYIVDSSERLIGWGKDPRQAYKDAIDKWSN